MLEIAVLLLALSVTVATFGLFIAIYLLLKRITQIPVDFTVPAPGITTTSTSTGEVPNYSFTGSVRDTYTPESADTTVPLDDFRPAVKKPLKVVYEDEDRITPVEDESTEKV